MADFTPITTSKGKFLVGKVPDDAGSLRVLSGLDAFIEYVTLPGMYWTINLPLGFYTFLFCTKEVTEQQAAGVVEMDYFDGRGYMYANYSIERKWSFGKTLHRPTESLRTLLLVHGLNPEDNFAFLKVNE